MDTTHGLLCAVVLLLIFYIVYKRHATATYTKTSVSIDTPAEEMHSGGVHSLGCPCRKCMNPESRALQENSEFFTSCADGSCDNGAIKYTTAEFGGTGGDFKDWITSQAVDTQVLVNHRDFVKDRFGNNNQNITGRTYAMGEVEGTDQVPWQGIRGRPQAVESCNPTQQPDVDMRNFTTKPRFTWNSS